MRALFSLRFRRANCDTPASAREALCLCQADPARRLGAPAGSAGAALVASELSARRCACLQ
eukprot:scaffold41124_cov63-Phaeocystis_antarctica.AAC.2